MHDGVGWKAVERFQCGKKKEEVLVIYGKDLGVWGKGIGYRDRVVNSSAPTGKNKNKIEGEKQRA